MCWCPGLDSDSPKVTQHCRLSGRQGCCTCHAFSSSKQHKRLAQWADGLRAETHTCCHTSTPLLVVHAATADPSLSRSTGWPWPGCQRQAAAPVRCLQTVFRQLLIAATDSCHLVATACGLSPATPQWSPANAGVFAASSSAGSVALYSIHACVRLHGTGAQQGYADGATLQHLLHLLCV